MHGSSEGTSAAVIDADTSRQLPSIPGRNSPEACLERCRVQIARLVPSQLRDKKCAIFLQPIAFI